MQKNRLWLVLLLVVVSLGAYGCSTTNDEPENVSSKPWNSPEGYQNGMLPSSMFQH
jgi:hypothetical protein